MTVFFSAFFGAILGQTLALWFIGAMAERVRKKQSEMAREAVQEYHSMMLKEQERMKQYVRMES